MIYFLIKICFFFDSSISSIDMKNISDINFSWTTCMVKYFTACLLRPIQAILRLARRPYFEVWEQKIHRLSDRGKDWNFEVRPEFLLVFDHFLVIWFLRSLAFLIFRLFDWYPRSPSQIFHRENCSKNEWKYFRINFQTLWEHFLVILNIKMNNKSLLWWFKRFILNLNSLSIILGICFGVKSNNFNSWITVILRKIFKNQICKLCR